MAAYSRDGAAVAGQGRAAAVISTAGSPLLNGYQYHLFLSDFSQEKAIFQVQESTIFPLISGQIVYWLLHASRLVFYTTGKRKTEINGTFRITGSSSL